MKLELLSNALFNFRNIAILFFCLIIAYTTGKGDALQGFSAIRPLLYSAAGAVYIFFVLQSVSSKSFIEKFNKKKKIEIIKDLNYRCKRLSSDAIKVTDSIYYQKLKKVMDDKSDIYDCFFRSEYSYLKEKILEQTLNLVISYINMLHNFCIRIRELASEDMSKIINRLNINTRKLNLTKDPMEIDNINNILDIDQKALIRFKEEKKELERIGTKLEYIEGTINSFKHTILSNIESEDMLEKLETTVNEASALNTVLEERRKNRLRN